MTGGNGRIGLTGELDLPAGLPIGPGWLIAPSSREVRFPYDGSVVALAPEGDACLAGEAVRHASEIRPEIARLSAGTRRSVLAAVAESVAVHRDSLIALLIAESGKPYVDCAVEVDRTALTWSLAAEVPAALHGETVPVDLLPSSRGLVGYFTRRPAGVVVGIAGFNYPLMLASHKMAPALAVGCPVIIKPAPPTPLATLWLADQVRMALDAAGAPGAAAQVVTGDTEVGVALTTDPRVAVVSFTGSAAVGHAIARAAAPRKTLLELGSNSALVVCADADLDAAVSAVLRGGYYASGQACISIQRVLVEQPVAADFERRLASRIGEVVVGDPRDPATRVAVLITPQAADRVLAAVGAALEAGARLVVGGVPDGAAVSPTVLADVPDGVDVWDEEVFGPVVAIRAVPDVTAAIDAVNASRYGLQAAIFTSSLATAHRAIDELEVGGVVVNDVPGFRSDVMPYGGVKDSGLGREGPRWAAEEFTVTRMAIIRGQP